MIDPAPGTKTTTRSVEEARAAGRRLQRKLGLRKKTVKPATTRSTP